MDRMDSILNSVKKLLGITEEQEYFDADIIMYINSIFSTLNQIGVGPKDGFSITDENSKWDDFVQNTKNIENVKAYVFLKVRMLFDPPSSATVMECLKQQASELEWRLQVTCDRDE